MTAPLSTTRLDPTTAPLSRRTIGRGLAVAAAAGVLATVAGQLPAFAAPGDTSAGTTVASVQVGSSIALTGLTPSFTLSGLPGATVEGTNAVSYQVLTNNQGGYSVGVTAEDTDLRPVGRSADSIPVGNLSVLNADASYSPLSKTGAITVARSGVRSIAAGDTHQDSYRINIPFVSSDTYRVSLDYVATAS